MNTLIVRQWKEDFDQPLSEELLRKHFPHPAYRVTRKLYRHVEKRPPGAARAGLLFVLCGRCQCKFGNDAERAIVLSQGQYVAFPEGRYTIQPLDDQDAEVVKVWNVFEFSKSPSLEK